MVVLRGGDDGLMGGVDGSARCGVRGRRVSDARRLTGGVAMSGRVESDARVGNGAGLSGLREHVCWAGVGAGRRGRGWAAHWPRGGSGQAGLVRSVGPGGVE